MKNILLQHYTGEMGELENLSVANMTAYAFQCNADYRLLRGNVFRSWLTPPCQKIYMLDEIFDEYDMVIMVDIDMFIRKGLIENIFTDVEGVGLFTDFTSKVFKKLRKKIPKLTNPDYPYWGGAIYRLDRNLRQRLRQHIHEDEIMQFDNHFQDEGIMHRLATLAKVEKSRIDEKWCYGSYLPNPENAAMIHVRTKITPDTIFRRGKKREKIKNYESLKDQGIIE